LSISVFKYIYSHIYAYTYIGGCTIDWYLPWPKEALVAVSKGFIEQMVIDCSPAVKVYIYIHIIIYMYIYISLSDAPLKAGFIYFTYAYREVDFVAHLLLFYLANHHHHH
jgi:hypothetical protein